MKKRILIAVAAVLVVAIGAAIWLGLAIRRETAKMSPAPTGAVADGVLALRDGSVDAYVVRGATAAIAIDAGNDAASLGDALEKAGFDGAHVDAVFLTHTDGDHVGGLGAFPRAKLFLSKDEEQMIDGRTHRVLFFGNAVDRPYSTLVDGQRIAVGDVAVQALSTPGHTPGSMSYLVNGKLLFTGDTLSLRGGAFEPFNDFFNMDTETERRSIDRLRGLTGVERVLTAHYGVGAMPKPLR